MNRRRTRTTSALLAGIISASCIGDSPDQEERPVRTASVDLRIGSVEGPGPVFGASHTIHDMAATPEGGVLVIDGLAGHLVEFDARGEFVRRFGRGGSGPGEFVTPAFLGMRGDTVWVSDQSNSRVSYFTRNAELIRTVTLRRREFQPPRYLLPPDGPIGDGRWMTRVSMGTSTMVEAGVERMPIVAVDQEGHVRDTLAFRRRGRTTSFVASHPDEPGNFIMRQPLANETHWAIPRQGPGILTAEQIVDGDRRLVVSRIAPTGDTLWSDRHPFRPMTLPFELLRPVRTELIENVMNARGYAEPVAAEMVDAALYAPEFLPTVTGLVMAGDTDFYVRREEPAPDQPQRWTFFSDREPVAEVLVPHGVEIHAAADGGVLWGIATDELDVAYVVRLRIGES